MRSVSNLARGSVSFNMTPMIDVVFLLIIFFLVSSNLAQQEVHLEIDLPDAASGNRPQEDDTRHYPPKRLESLPVAKVRICRVKGVICDRTIENG